MDWPSKLLAPATSPARETCRRRQSTELLLRRVFAPPRVLRPGDFQVVSVVYGIVPRMMINEIDGVDWESMGHAYGPASDVPGWLRGMVSADPGVREEAFSDFYSFSSLLRP